MRYIEVKFNTVMHIIKWIIFITYKELKDKNKLKMCTLERCFWMKQMVDKRPISFVGSTPHWNCRFFSTNTHAWQAKM